MRLQRTFRFSGSTLDGESMLWFLLMAFLTYMRLNQEKLYVRIIRRTLIGLQSVLTMPGGRS